MFCFIAALLITRVLADIVYIESSEYANGDQGEGPYQSAAWNFAVPRLLRMDISSLGCEEPARRSVARFDDLVWRYAVVAYQGEPHILVWAGIGLGSGRQSLAGWFI
ncbi:hypothetical protein BDZ89DRAFT_245042 [Hymenopellis radicata]|nr:hypothetical protein BDZ89DRAFT_245042 [Hymenopellis radicata]